MTGMTQMDGTDLIGVLGVGLYVLSYALLTLGRMGSDEVRYFALNWCGSACVLIGLAGGWGVPPLAIAGVWIAISALGIALCLWRRRAAGAVFASRRGKGFYPLAARPSTTFRTVATRSALAGWVPRNLLPGSGMRVKNSAPMRGS